MSASGRHPIYARDAKVFVMTGEDKIKVFGEIIEGSNFIQHVVGHWEGSGKSREEYLIAIKPNIMTASIYEEESPVYTDPSLVETLIEILRQEGFRRFVVVESQNVYSYSYTKRRVPEVAMMCGYGFAGYEVVDLSEDTVDFDYGGALGRHKAGRAWLEADYRISFAKNKTHWQCYYTACLKNVYGCLPEWDKMYHYHGKGIEFFQSTVLIADKIPVHFGLLDAWTSGDGLTGHVRDASPNQTRTFLASENIYALDWVVGEKMRVDPMRNYVMRDAVQRWGPIRITREGDMTPWRPWRNVRPVVISVMDFMEERYWLSRFMSRLMASRMDPRFPPVSRWQWFFGVGQALVRLIEGFMTKGVSPDVGERPAYEMAPGHVP
jgi:uncharacterized protein (DUF362 family)